MSTASSVLIGFASHLQISNTYHITWVISNEHFDFILVSTKAFALDDNIFPTLLLSPLRENLFNRTSETFGVLDGLGYFHEGDSLGA